MHATQRSKLILASTALALACCLAIGLWAALLKNGTEVEYNQARHDELLDLQIKSLEDLFNDYLCYQSEYLKVVPPNPPVLLVQSGGVLPLLDQTKFPASFIDGLAGYDNDGIERFPIRVYEDGNSYGREIVVENMLGKEIARIARADDYSPDWFVREQYPNFDSYPQSEREWLLANYDPARIVIDYELILDEKNLIRLVWKETILAAIAPDPGGGMMMMDWEGGPVTNLQFVDIEWPTNHTGIIVTLAYPEEYQTNENTVFEFFTCWDLVEDWWDPAISTNTDTSTNWVQWTDYESTNWPSFRRMYAAAVEGDQDDDGFSDGYEHFVTHTGEDDSNSYPVEVSGAITYSGPQTGWIWMVAALESNIWTGCSDVISSPGAYTNDRVAVSSNYWFKAFRDSNWNRLREAWEAQGIYSNVSMTVTTDLSGIDITLSDPDDDSDDLPDWWEMQYFEDLDETAGGDPDSDGLVNSNEYAESTDPSDFDTDDDYLVDGYDGNLATNDYPAGADANTNGYVDGEYDFGCDPLDSDSDNDGFLDGFEVKYNTDPTNAASFPVNLSGTITYTGDQTGMVRVVAVDSADSWASNLLAVIEAPGAYTVSNVANLGTWWVKAFRDSDGDQAPDSWEAWGASNSIYVATNMTGIDITLDDPDLDEDDMPDWWEVLYGLDPQTNDAMADADGDGCWNLLEYELGLDPVNVLNWLLPYTTGFESAESYALGTLDGQEGWSATSSERAQVQAARVHAGSQAVELDGLDEEVSQNLVSTNDAASIEIYIYIDGDQYALPTNLPETASCLLSYDLTNGVAAFDGDGAGGGEWVTASNTVFSDEWVLLGIDQDFTASTWDLSVNGDEKLTGLGFKDNSVDTLRGMHLRSGIGRGVHCDDLEVSDP